MPVITHLQFWTVCLVILCVGAVAVGICVYYIIINRKFLHPISQVSLYALTFCVKSRGLRSAVLFVAG
jgi:hypothetical protein